MVGLEKRWMFSAFYPESKGESPAPVRGRWLLMWFCELRVRVMNIPIVQKSISEHVENRESEGMWCRKIKNICLPSVFFEP